MQPHPLSRASQGFQTQWPVQVWDRIIDVKLAIEAGFTCCAALGRQFGRNRRHDTLKAIAQAASTFYLDPQRTIVTLDQPAPVFQRKHEIRQREGRLVGIVEQQRIKRAKAQLALRECAIEARLDHSDPAHGGHSKPLPNGDFGAFNGQIGTFRVTDHNIGQNLG